MVGGWVACSLLQLSGSWSYHIRPIGGVKIASLEANLS